MKFCPASSHELQNMAEAEANFAEAEAYYLTKNYAEAVPLYRMAAEAGHANAQFRLADCYFYGHGVAADEAEAVKWRCNAAENGHPDAQYWLGYCYYLGHDVEEDEAKALQWFRKAAAQDHLPAKKMVKRLTEA